MSSLKDKNIIVTGASGGIGNSITEKLNQNGANILATGTRFEKLEELKEKFDNIVNRIQRQGEAFIESARNSIRISSRNINRESNALKSEVDQMFKTGEEFLESNIEERQKQIELISKYIFISL
jgi:short-subunit dehydrogenase